MSELIATQPVPVTTPRQMRRAPARRSVPAGAPIRPRHTRGHGASGFTLIELLIVVLVISILATLAVPTYVRHIVRATRSDAEAVMLDLATQEHQYFMANRRYANETDLGFTMPASLASDYTVTITTIAGPPPGFTITFNPVTGGPQQLDGALSLDSAGNKTPQEKW